jgi:hypothetical protein
MGIIPKNMVVYGKSCIGCVANGRPIMVAAHYREKEENEFIDLFISNEVAEELALDLLKTVARNRGAGFSKEFAERIKKELTGE